MDRAEWDLYLRTGVVHVLAISGQHLVILAGFLWGTARLAGVHSRHAAVAVTLVILAYTVLTGLRPSGVRAAVMVLTVAGAILLRRPVNPANALAAGWLAVLLLQPTDIFTLGCQLSFLAVVVLVWGIAHSMTTESEDPLDQLIDASRSWPDWLLRRGTRSLRNALVLTALLSGATGPLILSGTNIAAPIAILLGPPLVLLTTIALVSGFLLILLAPLGVLAPVLAFGTTQSLAATGWMVRWGAELPGATIYAPAPPLWWVTGYTLLVLLVVLLGPGVRRRGAVALLAWLALGLVGLPRPSFGAAELRVTFLAVGHGGCIVLETPDGRCLMVDCGTTAGPNVVRWVVAPFLWHRGIRRIDQLFLSHADADHINGVPELLRYFPVGSCIVPPSFPMKTSTEVNQVLAALQRHGVPLERTSAGELFQAESLMLEVLHPPSAEFGGSENERSLVLAVRHAGQTILLTGDLEKQGTVQLVRQPRLAVDVLMAPHHGSRGASPELLAAWCRPRLVVLCRGNQLGQPVTAEQFGPQAILWNTQTHGAIQIQSHGLPRWCCSPTAGRSAEAIAPQVGSRGSRYFGAVSIGRVCISLAVSASLRTKISGRSGSITRA
jgi:competence protein ComEC